MQELHDLARVCGEHETFVLLAGYTGLRWGELTALRVKDVDLLRLRVNVERAYSMVGGKLVLGSPKDHERRAVALPKFLREPLTLQLAGKQPNDLLFATGASTPLNNRNWSRRVLEKAWYAAGIERLTAHDLRHTAASLAVAAGANVKAVQQMLGHASAAMTLDVYSGLFDGHLDDVAARMNDAALPVWTKRSAHSVPTDVAEVRELPI